MHEQIVTLQHALNTAGDALPTKVAEVIKAEFTAASPSTDLKKFSDEYAAKHKGDVAASIAAIKARKVLGEDKAKYEADLAGLLKADKITFEEAAGILDTLKAWGSREAEGARAAAREKWPEVTGFA